MPDGAQRQVLDYGRHSCFAAGTPGTIDPSTQELVGAEEPNWRKVASMSEELLGKTKDLRVAAWLARAELANRGLTGLCRTGRTL